MLAHLVRVHEQPATCAGLKKEHHVARTRSRARAAAPAAPSAAAAGLSQHELAALAQADALGWSVFIEAAGELVALAQRSSTRRLIIILGGSVDTEGRGAFYEA